MILLFLVDLLILSEQITKGLCMEKEVKIILCESSIFQSITALQALLKSCATKCQRIIKKGPNYQQQVAVCTAQCKVKILSKIVAALTAMKGSGVSQKTLEAKISYFYSRLEKQKVELVHYRQKLKNRQIKVPVAMSAKPSPERYNPRADLK